MQLKTIHSFITLYQIQNISKASEALYLTQQGLSRQIKALEEELGFPLFIRSKHGVTPTEICHRLYPLFFSIDQSALKIQDMAAENNKVNPHLRIGLAYGLSNAVNNDFLISYQQKYPDISLEIQEWRSSVCQEKLFSGELDLAVLLPPFDQTHLACQLLLEGDMYAAMHKSHALAASDQPMPFQLLEKEKITTGPPDNMLRSFFDHCCRLANIQPQVLMSSSYNIDFVNSVTYNTGVTPMTTCMAHRITNPDIRVRKLILPTEGNLYLCSDPHGSNQAAKTHFTRYVVSYFKLHPLRPYCPPITTKS